ncbi:hypothetical protein [Streptomyces cinnamoneus]|uniref:hypothetical protein n=1 Tax=Streptomyces cinnamoneus TaxID=53446 RepID=UPI001865A160|nr:hypothetical protein [Streptomyces cinnamoneus]
MLKTTGSASPPVVWRPPGPRDDHRLGRRRGELEDDLGLRGRRLVRAHAQEPQHL